MRLINVETKCLELFYRDPTEPYAILSHTWGKEDSELSFQDMQRLDKCDYGRRLKLDRSCRLARQDGIKYVWIDTCCIDKTNSVELSEAINSMFRWYQKSTICYAYLSDVVPGGSERIHKSRWFSRGWTLQELLAPRKVSFFDTAWNELGTRSSLSVAIGKATGIPHHILTGIASLNTCSVAQRMSWASRRTTTRQEDMAYCLLGIFDVTISPIYGEGLERAFGRLQEAIMKQTHDDSILAWSVGSAKEQDAKEQDTKEQDAKEQDTKEQDTKSGSFFVSGGVMATSPAAFKGCGDIVRRSRDFSETHIQKAPEISGGAMSIRISLSHISSDSVIYGYLSCGPKSQPSLVAAIPLIRCPQTKATHGGANAVYLRPRALHTLYLAKPELTPPPQEILIRNERAGDINPSDDKAYWLYLPPNPYPCGARIDEVYPEESFEKEIAMIKTPRGHDLKDANAMFLSLIRFSYPHTSESGAPVGEEQFILVLEFFKESAAGSTEPRAYLYFDAKPPTPFSRILPMWPSLSCSRATEITKGPLGPMFTVSVGLEIIDGRPIWEVNLGDGKLGMKCTGSALPGWPSINTQIWTREQCLKLVQTIPASALSFENARREKQNLKRSSASLDKTRGKINDLESQIASLMAELKALQCQAEKEEKRYSEIRDRLITLELDAKNSIYELNSRDGLIYGRTIWPTSADSKRLLTNPVEWKRDQDGVIRYLMQKWPIESPDVGEMPWVPGITLLMYAAATGDPNFVRRILRYDSDLEARDSEHRNAADWTALYGRSRLAFLDLVDQWNEAQGAVAEEVTHDLSGQNDPEPQGKETRESSIPPVVEVTIPPEVFNELVPPPRQSKKDLVDGNSEAHVVSRREGLNLQFPEKRYPVEAARASRLSSTSTRGGSRQFIEASEMQVSQPPRSNLIGKRTSSYISKREWPY